MPNMEEKEKQEIAKKLWNTPFVSTNLQLLKKSELLILVREILNRIGWEYETQWHELDIKDILFEEKCWLIETLDPDFFKKDINDK